VRKAGHSSRYSFHGLDNAQGCSDDEEAVLGAWAEAWYTCVAGTFLKSYLDSVQAAPFIPRREDEMELMLPAYLMEKAIYEVAYELNNRPDWVGVPLRGILTLLGR
jgi:maltose alpha-D-glucosyltransferase/alpha-amylase